MTDASGPPESSGPATTDKNARDETVVHSQNDARSAKPSDTAGANAGKAANPSKSSDTAGANAGGTSTPPASTKASETTETGAGAGEFADPSDTAGTGTGKVANLPDSAKPGDTTETSAGAASSHPKTAKTGDTSADGTSISPESANSNDTADTGAVSGTPETAKTSDTTETSTGAASGPPESAKPGGTTETGVSAASGPPESSLAATTDKNSPSRGVVHRFLPAPDSRLGRFIQRVQPDEEKFRSPAHHEKVTARIGIWLGVAFLLCFLTGLLSHLIQHPPSWFAWPSQPASLYRITQGVHVLSGIAAIPLLLAKLWSVYPKLFSRPVVRSLPHALERLSILILSGAAFFELATGLFNATQNYPWGFYFLGAHYAVAWVAIGSVLLHVAVKLPVVRRGFAPLDASRRAFLRTTFLATGVAVVATAGATVPLLRTVSPLSWRSDRGPQGVPVNRTAAAARVAVDPEWRLEIVTRTGVTRLSLAQLTALPQRTAELPIACVEGWSQSASWTGVPVADLVELVGAPAGSEVHVTSLERRGAYRTSTLPGTHTRDPETLLALRLNGETLALDHGFPCRIIAPSRPGVLQTKWVHRLEVL